MYIYIYIYIKLKACEMLIAAAAANASLRAAALCLLSQLLLPWHAQKRQGERPCQCIRI